MSLDRATSEAAAARESLASAREHVERAILELTAARVELEHQVDARATSAYYDAWLTLETLKRVRVALSPRSQPLHGDRPLLRGVDDLREERDQ